MRSIKWRGGIGYGDIVNAVTYSYSCTVKYDQPVHTTILWPFPENFKYNPQDSETQVDRFNYINVTMMKGNHDVIFDHVFLNYRPSFRFVNNPDKKNALHGVWYHNRQQTTTTKVVVWSSKHNVEPIKHIKDPSLDQWDRFILWLKESGYDVVEVTYKTPIRDVIHHINTCCFGVGYDGMIFQLFKYLWKPVIVVSGRVDLNYYLVPQSTLVKNIDEIYRYGIRALLKESMINIRRTKRDHYNYLHTNSTVGLCDIDI